MFKINRLYKYIIIYIIVMSLFTLTDIWKVFDFAVYKSFYIDTSEEVELNQKIQIIDLPYKEESGFIDYTKVRSRLTDLLNQIKLQVYNGNIRPEAIIIDFYFPMELVSDTIGIKSLKEVIIELKEKDVEVFGVYNIEEFYDKANYDNFKDFDKKQAKELYDVFTNQRLHAIIEEKSGVLYYRSLYEIPKEKKYIEGENDPIFIGNEIIEALPINVKNTIIGDTRRFENEIHMLLIGDTAQLDKQTCLFTIQDSISGDIFSDKNLDLNDKFIIIGSKEGDLLQGITEEETNKMVTTQNGTQLLAWALSDQLSNNDGIVKEPLDNSFVQLGMPVFFAAIVVIVFGFSFKFIHKWQTRPLLLAIWSLFWGLFILLFFGYIKWGDNQIIPLGFTLISIITASILSWQFCNTFIVTRIAEGSGEHDVFISYSHGDEDWVKENLFKPLSEYVKPDGSKLDIFFDKNSIINNEIFTKKYMWGIVNSKLFVPVMSQEYSKKNHCQNEMDLAYTRKVEQKIKIFTIAFSFEFVPEIYRHTLITDISVEKDFMESLKKQIV